MMMMRTRGLFAICAISALLAASGASAQAVGNIGAVNPDATGARPGASSRKLTLGGDVVQNERIQTNSDGTAQVAFVDRSSLNVGRNSTVVIDRFVYDPGRGAGEMSANVTRGALRFVGGQVSHTSGVSIQTPAATIGVRGGMATIAVAGDGSVRVISHYGVITVQNGAGSSVLRRPGYEIDIGGPNSAPGAPHVVDPAVLAGLMGQFGSRSHQHGGARTIPTDLGSAQFGIGSPRPDAIAPNLDLPAISDTLAHSAPRTNNPPPPPKPVYTYAP